VRLFIEGTKWARLYNPPVSGPTVAKAGFRGGPETARQSGVGWRGLESVIRGPGDIYQKAGF
jgi:hypothetical protein